MSDTLYKKENDFRVKELNLILDSGDVISLLDMVAEVSIYQDLFGAPMYCDILISDALDLYSQLPFKNTETLEISFLSPGSNTVSKQMVLYSRENINLNPTGSTSQYFIRFVSPEVVQNTMIKFSKSYNGTLSNMVGALWSENFKESAPITVEPTEGDYSLVLPFSSPMAHIANLTKRAQRKENSNECNYLFFENFRGFSFISLGGLFNQDMNPDAAFSYKNPNSEEREDNHSTPDLLRRRLTIKDLVLTGKENLIDEITNGVYNGFVAAHDVKNKSFVGLKYGYEDGFQASSHLNSHPITTESMYKNTGFLSQYNTGFFGVFPPEIRIKRQSQINSFLNRRIRFNVSGNSSVNVGDKIHVEFPHQTMSKSIDSGTNKYRSGFYLITSIKHTINKLDGYTMTIEACSDSYAEPLPENSKFEVEEGQGAIPR